jgi:hypothetical protein
MKTFSLLNWLSMLMIWSVAHSSLATGPSNGGGGYFAKVGSDWVLLETLVEMGVFDPQKNEIFEKPMIEVNEILDEVESRVPTLAAEMRQMLTTKRLHFVPYKLRCEDSRTFVNTKLEAGACQDQFDVWFNESKFRINPVGLIIHEMVQSIRLRNLMENDKNIDPKMVVNITALLTQKVFPSEEEILLRFEAGGFVSYVGSHGILAIKKAIADFYRDNCESVPTSGKSFSNQLNGKGLDIQKQFNSETYRAWGRTFIGVLSRLDSIEREMEVEFNSQDPSNTLKSLGNLRHLTFCRSLEISISDFNKQN